MSHTGLKILYEIVNRREDFACERVYAPWVDLETRMREHGIPLFSTESFAPVADFDVLGFSLQAELNYSNILNMLDLAGLPVWQRDRRESDPIVLGGGPCTANPEPIADFFDAFLVGDAEEALPVFLDAYREARSRGLSRRDLLAAARRGRRHLRAVVLRRHIQRGRAHRGDRAQRSPGARAGAPHLGARPEARLLPRQAHGALGRDRPGPPGPRGHARLHAGLPLLPGGLLVPARARARSRRRGRHDQEVHRRVGLERGRASLALDRGLLADRAPGEVPGSGSSPTSASRSPCRRCGPRPSRSGSPTPSRRSASPASRSRPRRARTACAASSTRRSPTRT